MIETLKHREAFEYYYGLGESRSLKKVCQKYTVSIPALKNWSKAFNWQERVQLRDQNNAEKLEQKTDIKVVDDKAKMLNIVRYGINLFAENLKKKLVAIDNVQDFERLVKMGLLLQGEHTESSTVNLSTLTREELMKLAGIDG